MALQRKTKHEKYYKKQVLNLVQEQGENKDKDVFEVLIWGTTLLWIP